MLRRQLQLMAVFLVWFAKLMAVFSWWLFSWHDLQDKESSGEWVSFSYIFLASLLFVLARNCITSVVVRALKRNQILNGFLLLLLDLSLRSFSLVLLFILSDFLEISKGSGASFCHSNCYLGFWPWNLKKCTTYCT